MGKAVSEWLMVTSGVPQGSVLGPILFVIFINDLSYELINKNENYADDTKVMTKISDLNDNMTLQRDIDYISSWSMTWSIDLNIEKCKVMHIGRNNQNFEYTIFNKNGTRFMSKSVLEKDLGIYVQNDLKWTNQVNFCAARGNRILGMLAKSFTTLNIVTLRLLYTSL